jgi:hypothetical protein
MTTITASWMDRPGSAISNPLPLCAFKFDIGRVLSVSVLTLLAQVTNRR